MVNSIDKQSNEEKEDILRSKPEAGSEKTRKELIEDIYSGKKEELKEKEPLPENERVELDNIREEVARAEEAKPEITERAKEEAGQIDLILGKEGKLKRLLDVAEEQGVIFSVAVAKKMEDPFTLDILHDILARDGFYKKFRK
jgi:FtsZ-interacting cell division protein ZipA